MNKYNYNRVSYSSFSDYARMKVEKIIKENEAKEAETQKQCVSCREVKHVTEYAPRRAICKCCVGKGEKQTRKDKKAKVKILSRKPEENKDVFDELVRMKW